MAEQQYVYNLTNEAEDIDKVLQDLVKILKDTTDSNTAVLAEITNSERRFKLGQAKTIIPGAQNQIVTANGSGGALPNIGQLFIDFDSSSGTTSLVQKNKGNTFEFKTIYQNTLLHNFILQDNVFITITARNTCTGSNGLLVIRTLFSTMQNLHKNLNVKCSVLAAK